MIVTSVTAYPWPQRCMRTGCERRARHAIVETGIDEGGKQVQRVRAFCTSCKTRYLVEVGKAQQEYREGAN